MVMEPGTLADARKAQEPVTFRLGGESWGEVTHSGVAYPENPATCGHREDVLWLAHRLRISEHRVADLGRQKRHLERRLRKALRGKRKH